jgi:hypothetical protein
MPCPEAVYPYVLAWIEALGLPQATARRALAQLVSAVLGCQRLTRAPLMRALWSPVPVPARQRFKRLHRALVRPWLTPQWLTPALCRGTLALLDPQAVPLLALDSVRLGRWEVFVVGVVWHRRVLPLSWVVLPYPLPKGVFTPSVCTLLRQVASHWPSDRAPHLLADRGFPSQVLFATLTELGWGFTVRLRAKMSVWQGATRRPLRDLLDQGGDGTYHLQTVRVGHGTRATTAQLVVGRGLTVVPRHQRGPGSARHRARQAARRQRDLAQKRPGRPGAVPASDTWLLLFTTHATWRGALSSYRCRWAIEGSFRDAQHGWDGRSGWGLDVAAARTPDAATVAALVGLWALGTLIQSWAGHTVGQPDAPAPVAAVRAQWTTSGRLSVWARGQLALTDPAATLWPVLTAALTDGAHRIAAAHPSVAPPGQAAA